MPVDHRYKVNVYSSRTSSWKTIGDDFLQGSSFRFDSGTLLKGNLHWLCVHGIVYFELKRELHGVIQLPAGLYSRSSSSLGACGGYICLHYDRISHLDVWLLKDQSWSKGAQIRYDEHQAWSKTISTPSLVSVTHYGIDVVSWVHVYHDRITRSFRESTSMYDPLRKDDSPLSKQVSTSED